MMGDMIMLASCFGVLALLFGVMIARPTQQHPDLQVMVVRRVNRGLDLLILPFVCLFLCSIIAGMAGGADSVMGKFDTAMSSPDVRVGVVGVLIVLIALTGPIVKWLFYH
jgi:hypothetical protein